MGYKKIIQKQRKLTYKLEKCETVTDIKNIFKFYFFLYPTLAS